MEAPDYDLPDTAIAQTPAEPRDAARLLDALTEPGAPCHRHVRDLPELIRPGDVVVVNDSRVIPARLHLEKDTGGAAEVLLLEVDPGDPQRWTALVRPGRRLPPGTPLYAPAAAAAPRSTSASMPAPPVLEVGERVGDDGRRRVRLITDSATVLAEHGEMALPPYIHEALADPDRYQTVFADRAGSVAAPTAGLHVTEALLEQIEAVGAEIHRVDLAVGLGTFRPVSGDVEHHVMHSEHYRVPAETWAACRRAKRVVAIGTTAVRALETVGAGGPMEAESRLFIRPGFRFEVVDVLFTNFHLPRSTLLLLLEAFAGPGWRGLYREAIDAGYRFLSFGDAMIVGRGGLA